MAITNEEARAYTIYQVGALKNFVDQAGLKIKTAKPHGAFYRWCTENEESAKAVLDGLLTVGHDLEAIHLPALPITPLHECAKKAGLRVVTEIYPGLDYDAKGNPRGKRTFEASVEDEARFVEKWLRTGVIDTEVDAQIQLSAETITVHGDMSNAPEIIIAIREVVEKKGVKIRAALD